MGGATAHETNRETMSQNMEAAAPQDFGMSILISKLVGQGAHLVQPSVRVHRLRVRFILDAVQVFMEPIQQESHELLGVVLGVTCKLTGFAGHDRLDGHKQTTGLDNEKKNLILQSLLQSARNKRPARTVLIRYLEFGGLESVMCSFP